VFIGFSEEHRIFQKLYGVKIEHLQTRNIADIAVAVKASDLCVTNENLVGAIAEGFKKTAVREINKGGAETLYCVFRRAKPNRRAKVYEI
jgi:hypothetical protein